MPDVSAVGLASVVEQFGEPRGRPRLRRPGSSMPTRAPPRSAAPSKHSAQHPPVPIVAVVDPTTPEAAQQQLFSPQAAEAASPWHVHGDGKPAAAAAGIGGTSDSAVASPSPASAGSSDEGSMPPRSKPSAFLSFLVVLMFVSLFASVVFLRHNPEKSTVNVLTYAWITTASTGVGALPFFFVTEMSRKWLGVANAVAGGMMSAASFGLILEALQDEKLLAEMPGHYTGFGMAKVLFGVAAGVGFMLWSKKRLDEHGDLELGNLHGASAQRALLIIGVMTLHSFAEGLAIGVAFGSKSSRSLGFIISSTLAVHNVPEGLAVSLTLVAKGTSAVEAVLWSVFSSLPQVIVAVPAYLFVEKFIPLVSIGLGFAAGAMLFVTFHELLREALDDLQSRSLVAGLAASSGLVMMALQYLIDTP